MNTEAISGRSSALPVSFSTIEASVSTSSLVFSVITGLRAAHNSSSSLACAATMSSISSCRGLPRLNT